MTELVINVKTTSDLRKAVQWAKDRNTVFEFDEDPTVLEIFFDYDELTKGDKISLRTLVKKLGAEWHIMKTDFSC